MSQLNLPWSNPRDRGRLNALRNIIATVSDDLRKQAPTASSIVFFATDQLPGILRQNTPLQLLNADSSQPDSISPYSFEIFDFVTQRPANSETFSTLSELLAKIPLSQLAAPLQNIELIGIDESKVDTPLPQSTFTFLKSIAFRMYKLSDGSIDEAVGPMLSKLYMQLGDDESFESKNQLLSYIRNNFVAYIGSMSRVV